MDASDLQVDSLAPTELWRQLADQIREAIASGQWPPSRKIPTQDQLMEALGISRGTATRAFELLREEGWLVWVKGKGVYSAPEADVKRLRKAR
jgi:DNA-binding GntR family transcriptional regulator